jgi:hypothetical protein|tara:strand:+ start:270 stop:473 length:204 start_codon:yes stop_codon:yes gene_type:complete
MILQNEEIVVYFESSNDGENSSGSGCEQVAIFYDEDTYKLCYPLLENLAKENRMIVTESIFPMEVEK